MAGELNLNARFDLQGLSGWDSEITGYNVRRSGQVPSAVHVSADNSVCQGTGCGKKRGCNAKHVLHGHLTVG